MRLRPLMVLGTASHVGKSLITAAFCRIFSRRGFSVAPFKAQNMSLNSAATIDGYEIGRAQALQAEAAYQIATREMNPILLKPDSESGCQVVVGGRYWGRLSAIEYHQSRVEELFPLVIESFHELAARHDLVILEGAGSPAEINLKDHDIVNMRMAAAADAACLLVVDIDRGGAFASLLGTLELLEEDERQRVRGTLINKFRGAVELLLPGVRQIEQRTGKKCLGVVPFIPDLDLDEEDSLALESWPKIPREEWRANSDQSRPLRIAVVSLPYFANFTDFAALAAEPSCSLRFVQRAPELEDADVIILPGTKNTIQDLAWLASSGMAKHIIAHARSAPVIGVCGGMQIMGISISDPDGMENGGRASGLCLLPIHTVLKKDKTTVPVTAHLISPRLFGLPCAATGATGYEIHLGETQYQSGTMALFRLLRRNQPREVLDGAQNATGLCFGTYVHGVFDCDEFRHSFLTNARAIARLSPPENLISRTKTRDDALNRLADTVERSVDMGEVSRWLAL